MSQKDSIGARLRAFVVFGSLLFTAASCSPSVHLGDVNTSQRDGKPGTFKKTVVLRGKVLTGKIEARYEGGRSYLNGHLWRPQPDRATGPGYAPRQLNAAALKSLSAIPYVRTRLALGLSGQAAAEELIARQIEMLEEVRIAYRQNRSKGSRAARQFAITAIDTSVAVADTLSAEGPKFHDDGTFAVYLRGVGFIQSMSARGTGEAAPPPRPELSLSHAKRDFNELRLILSTPTPSVIIYAISGTMILT